MSKSFAEIFLDQVREAMTKTPLLEKQMEWKHKWTPPKLVPENRDRGVDEEEFKQFETVVNFLRLTLFGVCDRTRLVKFYLLDETRYQTTMPSFHVPNTPFEASEREILEALDLAHGNASGAQRLVEMLQETLTRKLQSRYKREDREEKARLCVPCDGKGWVRNEEVFKKLECHEQDQARRELGGYNRVFCDCQKDNDDI